MAPGDVVHPNEGETITCIRSSKDGGRFVFELALEAGFDDSPPMHAHPDEEIVEITSGTAVFDIAGEKREVRAGERLVIPAGTMHTFGNASKTEAVGARCENGAGFERLIDQFTGGGPGFVRLAQQVMADPAAYRTAPVIHFGLRVVAMVGRMRGIRPHPVE